MRGLGIFPAAVVRKALQAQGKDGNIVNPFSEATYAWITYPSTESPPHYWERIRGSGIYGPGASGNYAWMNDPSQWVATPEETELLNLNRDIIKWVPRFEDINWNDPRIRFPDSFMPEPAALPLPELPAFNPPPQTPAGPTAPVFNPTMPVLPALVPSYYQPAGSSISYEPLPGDPDPPMGEDGTPTPVQAGMFGGLSLPMILTIAGGILFFSLARGAGRMSPRRRRRR